MSMANLVLGRGDGVCHCKECVMTPEQYTKYLELKVSRLEHERRSKYQSLQDHFHKVKDQEVKEAIKAIKITNKERAKLKKFIKGSMPKNKVNWALSIWLEVDTRKELQEALSEYREEEN